MNKNVKQAFETLAIAVICTVFVLSMHQSCSEFANKNTEIKKAQELKNDTLKNIKFGQRVR
jgi:hypothetical protein